MYKLLLKLNLTLLILLIAGSNIFSQIVCVITGPTVVTTNIHVTYRSTIINSNWEVYSYNGAQAQLLFVNYDSLQIDTGPTLGNITIYCLSNPQKELLCSLNVSVEAALPVEMISFTSSINERTATLNWSTSNEENNSGFEVQRATGNGEWSIQKFIAGKGTFNIVSNYVFEDKNLSTGRYNYRLKQIDYNGNFKYFELQNDVVIGIPEKFSLSQNFPNPFNPVTKISYDIPKDGFIKIKVFDITGKEVANPVNEFLTAGYYSITFNGASLTSGLYFYKLEIENFNAVRKMLLVK